MNKRKFRLEVLLWSIAFPGFGQFLNKKYFKAITFIVLEVMINLGGKVNTIIMESFLLHTKKAIEEANYLWLMFYPCIYLFAIWDAYKDAGAYELPFMYIPFVMSAYTGTLGVIYSSKLQLLGFYLGPVFLPLIFMVLGFFIGVYIRKMIYRYDVK